MESSQSHAETLLRAAQIANDQMQQEISRLEVDKKLSLSNSIFQSRSSALVQHELDFARSKISIFDGIQSRFQDEVARLTSQRDSLQNQVTELQRQQQCNPIDAVAQAGLAATFDQACIYIRDLANDKESAMSNFKSIIQQMQENTNRLEVEKCNALSQVSSQANFIAITQSDLEQSQLRISELVRRQQEATDSQSLIALLEERAERLTIEKNDALKLVASHADLVDTSRIALEKAQFRIADLELREKDCAVDSNSLKQLREELNTLKLEKDMAIADAAQTREDAAAQELKLQNLSSKLSKCRMQMFSLHVNPIHPNVIQPCNKKRYRIHGLLSEIGVRRRRQCHALSIFFQEDSQSFRFLTFAHFMIAWAQFVTISKFHRQNRGIENFRYKNRSTYFILKIRRNFVVSKFFFVWKANSVVHD
jgi:chromosome segregation ATPase